MLFFGFTHTSPQRALHKGMYEHSFSLGDPVFTLWETAFQEGKRCNILDGSGEVQAGPLIEVIRKLVFGYLSNLKEKQIGEASQRIDFQ